MTGREYLEDIRSQLRAGRNQHRMGENILRAFGYVRRRATAVQDINSVLDELGLVADPPINSEMPLKAPRIRFSLKNEPVVAKTEVPDIPESLDLKVSDTPPNDVGDSDSSLPEPAFRVSELASAKKDVERIEPNAPIEEAFTLMVRHKYSQLVVASGQKPRQPDIKGIVSFQSMTKALMNGKPKTVGDCIDRTVPIVKSDTDLKSILSQLRDNEVVLVVGQDSGLQGIVTAWDLAEEFAELVDPFNRLGEIEERLRALVKKRLGKEQVAKFLSDHGLSGESSTVEIEELTMGELERVLENPNNWNQLGIVFDRNVFIMALAEARGYRNRLMHFRDPLTEGELSRLTNICDMVREIPDN